MNKNITVDEGKLSSSVVMKCFWRFFFLWQVSWNFERMQAHAFVYSIIPALRKIYTEPEEFIGALKRHLEFFNTNLLMVAPLLGGTIALEEQRTDSETIRGFKTGLMGPFAGIGDTVFFVLFNSIVYGFAASLALEGSILGPIIVAVTTTIFYSLARYNMFWQGYKQGINLIKSTGSKWIKQIQDAMSMLGLAVVAALGVSVIKATTPIAFTMVQASEETQAYIFQLQPVLDQLLPKFLVVLFVGMVYYLIKKGMNPSWVALLLIVIGILFKALGILA
jgi:mannose/fructose/N-acetylgalactosamine-specific phosphotransferase system component IID